MKRAIWLAAAAVALLSANGHAQDANKGQPAAQEATQEQGVTPPDTGPHSGTKPGGMGSTGWTGGRRDSNSGAGPETSGSGPNINNDSEYATGDDLKGPAAKFPANRTPE